ncbi:hypothetical protein BHUM_01504c [Candidatus Burkholderia humilis]|nr:hypothetical protein BHUM_01504c [Candidatus Burkholderia humilis]
MLGERALDPAGRILDEHEIPSVQRRKGLLIGALDRRLDRCAQGLLDPVDQSGQAQRWRMRRRLDTCQGRLRWLWGVASVAGSRSQSPTWAGVTASCSTKAWRNACSTSCRDSAAEHGQVEA